jgi:hypothetical protein
MEQGRRYDYLQHKELIELEDSQDHEVYEVDFQKDLIHEWEVSQDQICKSIGYKRDQEPT